MLTFLVLVSAMLLLAGCAVVNRFYVPPDFEEGQLNGTAALANSSVNELTVTTWNIGYGGMGAESDFVFDGGEQRRPLNSDLVDKNLALIKDTLNSKSSDIFVFQEAAQPSWLTYNRDVLSVLTTTLVDYEWSFGPDVYARGVPPPFNVQVGNATFSRILLDSFERRGLPLEPTFEYGLFRKGYRMHVGRINQDPTWVVINIHLSTFDTEKDDVRGAQVKALLDFAQSEYESGRHVIIGGDWNLRLLDTNFPHSTKEEAFFWVRDFPRELLPNGWTWAVDDRTPTVRSADKPYVKGENFGLIIDGFLVSPNVRIVEVTTDDLNFQFTDHHPVTARFQAR